MALDLTPEQKTVGQANFNRVVGKLAGVNSETPERLNRREFMQGLIGAGTVLPLTAAAYFGYGRDAASRGMRGNPIKAGLIGCGDEGGVLASEHDKEYVQIVKVCDIRPTNQARIFDGEGVSSPRKGLNYHYGNDARRDIPVVERYQDILSDPQIRMVIIALPLNLHYQVTMDDFRAWKAALGERPSVRFQSYPALNHLFTAGTGPSGPAEYRAASHVDGRATHTRGRQRTLGLRG